MIKEAIENFAEQFLWEPILANEENLQRTGKYIICGMGGSHLQGDIMQNAYPGFDLSVHQDYGLPAWPPEVLKNTLIITSSYSGNTQETLAAFHEAIEKGYPLAVSTTGGKLLELTKKHQVSYVQLPNTGIHPRSALGFTFKALAKIVGKEDALKEAASLALKLNSKSAEHHGKELAHTLRGKAPVIYASNRNYSIAYNWKIKFNESSKIPAFYNLFPELNHNELEGFDITDSTRGLSEKLFFILLKDDKDDPRIQKRMEVLENLYQEKGMPIESIVLEGRTTLERIFISLLLADWTAYHLASYYKTDPEQVPLIEEFKKLIA